MTDNKPTQGWIDPRLLRPAGWSPPAPTETDISRGLASVEGLERQVMVTGYLSTLVGAAQFAYQCRLFYTDSLSPLMLFGDYWSPWRYPGKTAPIIRGLIAHLEADAASMCRTWLAHVEALDELNREWAQALATLLQLPMPQSEEEYQMLRDRVESLRQKEGAVWAGRPEFQPLAFRLQKVVVGMQQLLPALRELLRSSSAQISPVDWQVLGGMQQTQDRLEAARAEPSHKRAIKMLARALRDSPAGRQAAEAYAELGFRYGELGELELAIENYTKAIAEARPPNPLAHYGRGELYYRRQEWDQATQDFAQAVALGLPAPEDERAQRYLSELRARGDVAGVSRPRS